MYALKGGVLEYEKFTPTSKRSATVRCTAASCVHWKTMEPGHSFAREWPGQFRPARSDRVELALRPLARSVFVFGRRCDFTCAQALLGRQHSDRPFGGTNE